MPANSRWGFNSGFKGLTGFGHYNAHHQEPVKLPLQPLVSIWMWRCSQPWHCSTCFGHYYAHHQEPVKLPLQPLVSVWMWRWKCSQPWLRTLPPPHSYGNQRLQRQFDGLLMMGIVMPETCWAVSVRQSNKILLLIVASSSVIYFSDWKYTEPQTLKTGFFFENRLHW